MELVLIRIRVELVAHGWGEPKQIGYAEIANITERRPDYKDICDYEVSFSTDAGEYGKVTLERFERKRGFWSLISEALSQVEKQKSAK